MQTLERRVKDFEQKTGRRRRISSSCFGGKRSQKGLAAPHRFASHGTRCDRNHGGRNQKCARDIRHIERDLEMPAEEIKRRVWSIIEGETRANLAKKEPIEANLRLVVSIAKKYTKPRASVPRLDPRGQHWLDEGSRQVRISAGLQILYLRDLVDTSSHHPGDRGPGSNHPHPGSHD